MKNVKIMLPLMALFVVALVSCTKEQKNLNRMEGRWKLMERLFVNYPGAEPITGENIYVTFNSCKPGEVCSCLLEQYDNNGEIVASETNPFHMDEDENTFVLSEQTIHIVSLTKTDFVFTTGEGEALEQSTWVKD